MPRESDAKCAKIVGDNGASQNIVLRKMQLSLETSGTRNHRFGSWKQDGEVLHCVPWLSVDALILLATSRENFVTSMLPASSNPRYFSIVVEAAFSTKRR